MRREDENGFISTALVMGKSHLAPIKPTSILTFELSEAVVAVRLYEVIREELEIQVDQFAFWTDSTIVL